MRNYSKDYPGFVNAPDAAYPQGSPKNATTDTAEDGTPVEQGWVADQWGFMQSVMYEAGDTPNEQSESVSNPQILTALKKITRKEIQNTAYTENRLKGQQNWSIPDSSGDPIISATPKLYSVGEFPADNVEVVTSNAVNLERSTAGIVKGDSGTLRIYGRSLYRAGVIDETTEYMGIKDHLGVQLEAGVATGVTKGNNGTDLYIDVNLAQLPNGFRYGGISAERGLWGEVSDNEVRFDNSNLKPITVSAWVNFNGQGAIVVGDGYNSAGVTDLGTGSFRFVFGTPLKDANYNVQLTSNVVTSNQLVVSYTNKTTTHVDMFVYENGVLFDPSDLSVTILGGQ